MLGGQLLQARRCHVYGEKRSASDVTVVRKGHVQRSAVASAAKKSNSAPTPSARRLAPLTAPRVSEAYAHGTVRENGAPVVQHQQSSAMTRTNSPVSVGRPIVLGSPPGSLGGSHTQPANTGIAAYGCYRLFGPALISKRGDCLIARLLPGARLELLTGGRPGGGAAAATAVETAATAATGADATPRSRTVTAEAATAGMRAEANGWDVQCECASASDGDSEDAGGGDGGGVSDDGAVTECVLVAAYVELGGSASSVDLVDTALQPAVHHHNGHTYLSVRNLPPGAVITLSADGDLSHPVNVTPAPPPPEAFTGAEGKA